MQTSGQIHAKIDELLVNFADGIHMEVGRLLKSGAVNQEDASDDFRLPRLLYVMAMRYMASQYEPMPHDKQGQKELKNLTRI